jgi:hypothetical protein
MYFLVMTNDIDVSVRCIQRVAHFDGRRIGLTIALDREEADLSIRKSSAFREGR